jgi:hypothetical protein
MGRVKYLAERFIIWLGLIYSALKIIAPIAWMGIRVALFASTYQPGLSAVVQCFSLTVKHHQLAYQL